MLNKSIVELFESGLGGGLIIFLWFIAVIVIWS